eukprot:1734845-Amphidinium_carterae.1
MAAALLEELLEDCETCHCVGISTFVGSSIQEKECHPYHTSRRALLQIAMASFRQGRSHLVTDQTQDVQ